MAGLFRRFPSGFDTEEDFEVRLIIYMMLLRDGDEAEADSEEEAGIQVQGGNGTDWRCCGRVVPTSGRPHARPAARGLRDEGHWGLRAERWGRSSVGTQREGLSGPRGPPAEGRPGWRAAP